MNIFLRLRHWQYFLLSYFLPFTLILFGAILSDLFEAAFPSLLFTFSATAAILFFYYGWIWKATTHLHSYANNVSGLNIKRFKVYFKLALILAFIISPIIRFTDNTQIISTLTSTLTLLLLWYCIYFSAVTMRIVLEQAGHKSYSIVMLFFMIWLLPIGIWLLQPALNKFKQIDYQKLNNNSK